MLEKEMQQVKVYTTEEKLIVISQDVPDQMTPNTILLHPDQIDRLTEWLHEAKNSLR
jgi:hypothetical protein